MKYLRQLPLISTIVVVLAAAIMVGLGFWQLGRADEKEELLARYAAAGDDQELVAWPGDDKDLLKKRLINLTSNWERREETWLDLMNQGHLRLDAIEVFILDEADRMLDMGFIHDVKKIIAAVPNKRQTLLFSATMPNSVQGLADGLLRDPVRVEITPSATTVEKIDQRVLFVPKDKKRALLGELMNNQDIKRVLIFTRTKHGADRVARHLHQCGVQSDAIHGNKAQNARQRALKSFRSGHIRALVATDIAARGIDVDGVTHVINFDLPNDPESYVHRIGRTARAGATGMAISFCDHDERAYLRDIEKTIRQGVEVIVDHPYHSVEIANDPGTAKRPPQRGGFKGKKRSGNGNGPGQRHRQNRGRGHSQRSRRSGGQTSGKAA